MTEDNVRYFMCSGSCLVAKIVALRDEEKSLDITGLTYLLALPMYVHAFISVLVSVWAIASLASAIKQSKLINNTVLPPTDGSKQKTPLQRILKKFKGCRAIMIINFTSLVMVIFTIVLLLRTRNAQILPDYRIDFCHVTYAVNLVIPTLMAATNPLILVWFNEDLRARVGCCKKRTNEGRRSVQTAVSVVRLRKVDPEVRSDPQVQSEM